MQIEQWKKIKNYENLYEISSFGRLRTIERWSRRKDIPPFIIPSKYLKVNEKRTGYLEIGLSLNNERAWFLIHRLVAEHFIDNPSNFPQVNHKDGNKYNNNVLNLEWCTAQQNIEHAVKNDLRGDVNGEKNGMSKYTKELVFKILEALKDRTVSQKEIAKKYNVTPVFVTEIKTGRKWAAITGIKYQK